MQGRAVTVGWLGLGLVALAQTTQTNRTWWSALFANPGGTNAGASKASQGLAGKLEGDLGTFTSPNPLTNPLELGQSKLATKVLKQVTGISSTSVTPNPAAPIHATVSA